MQNLGANRVNYGQLENSQRINDGGAAKRNRFSLFSVIPFSTQSFFLQGRQLLSDCSSYLTFLSGGLRIRSPGRLLGRPR